MRTHTTDILKANFANNADLKKKCLTEAKSKISRHLVDRVFDGFPLLMDKTTFEAHVDLFKDILKQPSGISIEDFQKSIINMGCEELLERDGSVKKELVKDLEWNNLPIDTFKLICAFVEKVTLDIFKESEPVIQVNLDKFTAVSRNINHHYGQWILGVMRQRELPYDPVYDTDQVKLRDIITFVQKPGFMVSLGVGGVFGAVAYMGYKVYEKMSAKPAALEDDLELDLQRSSKKQ